LYIFSIISILISKFLPKIFFYNLSIQPFLFHKDVTANHYIPKTIHQIGPGENLGQKTSLQKIAYTLGIKHLDFKPEAVPGPGRYEFNQTLTPNGQYTLSRNQNTKQVSLATKAERFENDRCKELK
jgi:hypothetical protein